jgi:hypothetical protein
MKAVFSVLNLVRPLNSGLLAVGRWLGVFAIGVMVAAILIQVFFSLRSGQCIALARRSRPFLYAVDDRSDGAHGFPKWRLCGDRLH